MDDKDFPSWGRVKSKDIGGGWIPAFNDIKHYDRLDMIEFDILSYRLYAIINEGRQTLMRVSGSTVVAEGGEALFAIYDPYGSTSSLACGLLLHVIGTEGFIKEILEVQSEFPGIFDDDIFLYNEPLIGGIHAADQWTGMPLFHEGELICWFGSLTHTAETGAIEPGGFPASSRSLLHEGYRVQGLKIQERGKINNAVLLSVQRSTRDPAYYTLDMRAKIAGINVAKARIKELIARYGVEKVKAVLQQNMEHSEQLARAKLRSLADGTWRAVNYGDWDTGPKLWKVMLTATKEGEELTLDFTGSSEANQGPMNCMLGGTWGSIFVGIASQLFWEIPANAGIAKPLRVIAPEGSLVNTPFLTPCVMCPALPGRQISSVVTMIVAKMCYTNEKYWGDINAPWCTTSWVGMHWGGMTQHSYVSAGMFGDPWARGTGAGIDEGRGDGCDSGALQMTIESCIPDVEMTELGWPFLYLWRREEMDTAAPGRWRGGASISFATVPHNSPNVTIAFRGTGQYAEEGQSLDGAYPPSFGRSGPAAIYEMTNLKEAMSAGEKPDNVEDLRKHIQEKGGKVKRVKLLEPAQPVTGDDVIVSLNAGAGGVGDPLDREPERVLADVQRRIFSLEMAKEIFGVVIDPQTWNVDKNATDVQRKQIRARRKEKGKVWEKE
ncbi:hydantoinase B/oxoprolinase family protein [Chloroflexota bacterium]